MIPTDNARDLSLENLWKGLAAPDISDFSLFRICGSFFRFLFIDRIFHLWILLIIPYLRDAGNPVLEFGSMFISFTPEVFLPMMEISFTLILITMPSLVIIMISWSS